MMKTKQQESTIQLLSQPLDEVLKILTLKCLEEGNFKDAITYLKAAQVINPKIFNSLENISVHSNDLGIINDLNALIGRKLFVQLEDVENKIKIVDPEQILQKTELEEFMENVYQGNLKQIEEKVGVNPGIPYEIGRIHTHKHVIESISAYQYALLVNDMEMLVLFLASLRRHDTYRNMWVSQGNLETRRAELIQFDTIEILKKLCEELNAKESKVPWDQRIGELQALFPAWLIYFHMKKMSQPTMKIELYTPQERKSELFEKWFYPYGKKDGTSVTLGNGCAWIVLSEKIESSSMMQFRPYPAKSWNNQKDVLTYRCYLEQILEQIYQTIPISYEDYESISDNHRKKM